jgi:hypothetical protein
MKTMKQKSRKPVADDVIAVLAEIRRLWDSGPNRDVWTVRDVSGLRKSAVQAVWRVELEARFGDERSAKKSIEDALRRRLFKGVGKFDAAVAKWLNGDPDPLRMAVLGIVTTQAQRKKLADVLAISNIQPVTTLAQDLEAPPTDRVQTTISRILRDTQLSNRVKALHKYECQICGYTLELPDRSRYAEGHHLQPLGAPHDGPDVLGNIICLCPNHHAACDLAAIELGQELRSAVGHVVDQRYIDYHNELYRANWHASS